VRDEPWQATGVAAEGVEPGGLRGLRGPLRLERLASRFPPPENPGRVAPAFRPHREDPLPAYSPPRSRSVRFLNGGGRLLAALGRQPVSLDVDRLLERAVRNTGLDDYGDPGFEEPLRRLVAAWESESRLTTTGRLIVQRDTLRALENRLHLVHERKRFPEIADERVERPLFIVGLPRTGTSILHELLAEDPGNRCPMTWEVMWPWPRPTREHFHDDPRIRKADRYLRATDALIPGFKAMHAMGALLPQECCMLMNHDFMSMQYHCSNRVTSYQDWLDGQDMTPVYAFHREQLQHLQSLAPPTRWVLKSPQHLWSLDALLRVYPDARIVQTHRDPVKAAASIASLVTLLRGMGSDEIDPQEIGEDWAARLAGGLERAMKVRAEVGDDARFFDMHFHEYNADPVAMVRRIYAHFDLPWSREAEERFRHFIAANPPGRFGHHEYSLEGAGLDLRHERRRFDAYQRRFDIRIEAE